MLTPLVITNLEALIKIPYKVKNSNYKQGDSSCPILKDYHKRCKTHRQINKEMKIFS